MKKLIMAVGLVASLAAPVTLAENSGDDRMQLGLYTKKVEKALLAFETANYPLAFERLSETARMGNKTSQYLLSTMYLMGQGTEIDNIKGWAWLNVALEQREVDWKYTFRKVDAALSDELKTAAEPLIQEYTEKYGVKAQKMQCRKHKVTGSARPTHFCDKKEIMPGVVYINKDHLKI